MKKYFIAFLLLSSNLYAQSICERIQVSVVEYLELSETRIQFKNRGGLFNGGVCWWHSRLQRASAYLATFRPDLNPPTAEELQKILKTLKSMNSVVTIPGYHDFYSFTKAHQAEVQSMLEAWQREDGFINQQWIRGISGNYQLPAKDMKARMDGLYEMFQKSPHPMWVMAQIKGIESHAFLVLDMIPKGDGFEWRMIDSNDPLITKVYEYKNGDLFLKHAKDKYSFVPYSGFQKDYDSIMASVKKHCGKNLSIDSRPIPRGEIEVGH